ncbi:MAG TPA: serine protein kinase [Planctomycetota bacterium]|jgi:serine protein kinase|nr:serine protein kinase [Planctomycetota bacterium]
MSQADRLLKMVYDRVDTQKWRSLHWEGSFREYLDLVHANPLIVRNAFQRAYDMIVSYGSDEYSEHKERRVRYRFFSDPDGEGQDAIFGLDTALMRLVDTLKAGAFGYGPERRIILLHGPVGSSKSTVVRLMKRGLERYSTCDEGAIYTYSWMLPGGEEVPCPMNEEPLKLIPEEARGPILEELNRRADREYRLKVKGDLNPMCRFYWNQFMQEAGGDWTRVLERVKVRRFRLSEKERVGIGTFQPKDEKNQDSTELTGDINYRKIAEYGSDSDPRAFNFDGELNVANRGLCEFIEILKLDVAFLYDLLGATQEHSIKSKKFAQTDIDELIIGHTNEPEYRKLQNNELMEAFRDRTVKIDVPYNRTLRNEIRIYQRDFNSERIVGKHIAPHTVEVAALWAILTRLEVPKKANLTLLQKAKLYNGKTLPGFTEDNINELKKESEREGMEGISPRFIQDKLSNALVKNTGTRCINPFIVMNEIEQGVENHSLITDPEKKKRYRELLAVVKDEYEDIVKNEVQRAISADEGAIKRLCANYLDNVKAHTQRERVRNPYTGEYEAPDERLMRSIEEKIDIPESRKDDFRREIMNYIGALAVENRVFDYRSNERLHRALDLKLFEDQKDSIKLTSLLSNVVDKGTQEKIDIVKARLIEHFGYTDESATDVLNYVASIFARGDSKS